MEFYKQMIKELEATQAQAEEGGRDLIAKVCKNRIAKMKVSLGLAEQEIEIIEQQQQEWEDSDCSVCGNYMGAYKSHGGNLCMDCDDCEDY